MIKTYRPTSPGTRGRKSLVIKSTRTKPEKSLVTPLKGASGRSGGRITTRHKQRGAKKNYRMVDFKRDKRDVPAKVASIEYDPNRGPNIALLYYVDGEKRYILAPEGLELGQEVLAGEEVELNVGNALPMDKIPLGEFIHNIELNPGQGVIMARGAGNSSQILAKEGKHVNIKLPSGEVKRVLSSCYATIGVLSNADLRNVNFAKAGRKRNMGWRPSVRGVAMANPSDHPHAGSYSDTGIGMPSPKSPWGKKTRGAKTRRRKGTSKTIVVKRKVRRR